MSEYFIGIILITICLGQVFTLFKSQFWGVAYYLAVAPLSYFSIWQFATLDPIRLCGLLLILSGFFRNNQLNRLPHFYRHPFFLFTIYLSASTIIGSFYWPTESISSRSEIYSWLRGAVQLVNWGITIGAAWQIASVLSEPGVFRKMRTIISGVGLFHVIYAIYQFFGYYANLPITGIRRPITQVGAQFGNEQFANTADGSIWGYYRVNSLVGEPKDFGALLVFFLAVSLTTYIFHGNKRKDLWYPILLIIVLLLTFSTSSWISLLCSLLCIIWVLALRGLKRVLGLIMIMSILGLGIFLFSLSTPNGAAIIQDIWDVRLYSRLMGGIYIDLPVEIAVGILKDNPMILLFGTGLGGISFYIASILGGGLEWILFPNIGYIGWICNVGLLGTIIYLFSLRRGCKLALVRLPKFAMETTAMSMVGIVLLVTEFIYGTSFTQVTSIAFLIAAEAQYNNGKTAQPHKLISTNP